MGPKEVPSLVVVGDLCVDLLTALNEVPDFAGQTEQIVSGTTLTIGSSSAITACGAVRLQVPTRLVGVVGDDLFGSYLRTGLRDRGVDTTGIVVDRSLPTGTSTNLVLPGGGRAILSALGSIGTLRAEHLDLDDLRDAGHLHVGSYFLQTELAPDLPDLFARLRAAGVSTSIDPNYDPWERWDLGLRAVLPHTDVFFVNEHEAAAIAGNPDPLKAAGALLSWMGPAGTVVLKRGPAGAVGIMGRGTCAVPTPAAEVVDTVGAGDTLVAGMLAARLRGLPLEVQLRWGVVAGTLSTTAPGGVDAQPALDEVRAVAGQLHARWTSTAGSSIDQQRRGRVNQTSGARTRDEIASQPGMWRRAAQVAADSAAALPVEGARTLVLGCGTSFYVAAAYARLREDAGVGVTDAMVASELPARLRDYDHVVAISRSGTSVELVDALRQLRGRARVTALVGTPESPVQRLADGVVDLAFADETSVVQTRFATTGLAVLRASVGTDLDGLAGQAEQALRAPIPTPPARQLVVLARGWAVHLASEAALKCREAAGAWVESYPMGEYRHGPISVADDRTLVWSLCPVTTALRDAVQDTGAALEEGGLDPMAELVRVQRLAVDWADRNGRDADVPTHLSRSVTHA